ncbi:nuclear distribution protein PAC1 [Punctularia strigosozonata HHB-11173 SS5]|uniref:nuclear distribution protein PAC1 n=1 Tax=Punctularia strigosozonata (strain HHB-11173) TaxID=741275 RepID=UPI0004416387|nr:nuclear distribution protein PAC1 [Punctularia strigosozonata HHB-11173 SS5]EIN13958.1 nuclear distribution protein PAC1 [Punctularia strigosozonata HHB-11173 SS5]
MSNSLTDRQKTDLHKAILDYFHSSGYHKTLEQFKEEASYAEYHFDPSTSTDLLVKKWVSVIRLQKKIVDLESRLAQALQDNVSLTTNPATLNQRSNPDWLPAVTPPKLVLTGHRANVNAVAFHPRYSVLVSASDDSTMKVWDHESGELERTIGGHTRRVSDCEYDSKGKYLVSASHDLFIKLWDVDNEYKNTATFRGHEHSISSARFLPGDERIVSASRDQTVRVWEIATTHCIKVIKSHDDWVRAAVPSSDGRFVITSCMDHTSRVLELATGATKAELRAHDNVVENAIFVPRNAIPALYELVGMKVGPDSSMTPDELSVAFAVTASRDQKIKVWDARSGQCLYTLVGHDGWVHGLTFHPNGQYLLSAADDSSIRIWEIKTGRCIRKIDTGERFMSSLAWARQITGADASTQQTDAQGPRRVNTIASGCWDYSVKIWKP